MPIPGGPLGILDLQLTDWVRAAARGGYLWFSFQLSPPPTTPAPPATPVNAFALLRAGATNAFALQLPAPSPGKKANDEMKNELIELMRGCLLCRLRLRRSVSRYVTDL